MITDWGDSGNFMIADRVRARIKVRVERSGDGPWRRCITTTAKEAQVIPDEAMAAAIKAMETVTPPPGVDKSDWLKRYGPYALLAGAIAAAAPHLNGKHAD